MGQTRQLKIVFFFIHNLYPCTYHLKSFFFFQKVIKIYHSLRGRDLVSQNLFIWNHSIGFFITMRYKFNHHCNIMVWSGTKCRSFAWSCTKYDTMFWDRLVFLTLSFGHGTKCNNILARHHCNNIAVTRTNANPSAKCSTVVQGSICGIECNNYDWSHPRNGAKFNSSYFVYQLSLCSRCVWKIHW